MENQNRQAGMWEHIQWIRLYNEEKAMRTGRQPLAFTHHYGCQQNVSDGEKIDGMLLEMGYAFARDKSEADFILYNTCAVRENAEDRIFGNVGALKHAKARNPELIVALCGCMVQQEHVADTMKKSFPHVDLLFGPSALASFPELLRRRLELGGRVFERPDPTGEIAEDIPIRREGGLKAWVPVMYGCDNFCAYCVVPLVRGRERSRDSARVLAEVEGLIQSGYREVTLLGQNVNSYRDGDTNFVELLRRTAEIPGDFRIRFMTSHPKDCTRELIDLMAECPKICNHLHLPVQSGSNRILGEMNRRYTAESYLEIVEYAKKRIPDVTLTSDIIVGFPGEIYEDFLQTLDLIRRVGYVSLFTFLYSKRVETKAADMDDSIPDSEKKRWFQELLDAQNEISREYFESFVGKTIRVLADGISRAGNGKIAGRSEANLIVDFPGREEDIGRFVDVKITGAAHWALTGEII